MMNMSEIALEFKMKEMAKDIKKIRGDLLTYNEELVTYDNEFDSFCNTIAEALEEWKNREEQNFILIKSTHDMMCMLMKKLAPEESNKSVDYV